MTETEELIFLCILKTTNHSLFALLYLTTYIESTFQKILFKQSKGGCD